MFIAYKVLPGSPYAVQLASWGLNLGSWLALQGHILHFFSRTP